ncbi:hypothetical protein HZB94_00940 [Candidatus Falkowbacteria bacterium]|nr:hypothetical protein [Candidatus Falkowbacteria bacterium]
MTFVHERREKMAKGIMFFSLIFLVCGGCVTFLDRESAYSVLPFPEKKLNHQKSYTILLIPMSEKLYLTEQGTAWEVILRFPNGREETMLATLMAYWDDEKGEMVFAMDEKYRGLLLAVLPRNLNELDGARGIIWSHDHTMCVDFENSEPAWCPDIDEFNWTKASAIKSFATSVIAGSDADKLVKSWYKNAQTGALVKSENFALTQGHLKLIREQKSNKWKVVQITLTSGLTTLVVSLVATPLAGIVAGGLTASTQGTSAALNPPNLNFPEYASGLVRRHEQMAVKMETIKKRTTIERY